MNNDWREYTDDEDYLAHHGILGQKWGVRRFESASGRLTAAGKARYNTEGGKYQKVKSSGGKGSTSSSKNPTWADVQKLRKKTGKTAITRTINVARNKSPEAKAYSKAYDKWSRNQDKLDDAKRAAEKSEKNMKGEKKGLSDKQKKAIATGLAIAGTTAAAALAYKNRDKIAAGAAKIKQNLNKEGFTKAAVKVGNKAGTLAGKASKGASNLKNKAYEGYLGAARKAGTLAGKASNVASDAKTKAYSGYLGAARKVGTGAAKVTNAAESLGSKAKSAVSGGGRKVYTKSIETASSAAHTLANTAKRAKLDAGEAIAAGKNRSYSKIVQQNAKARAKFADEARKLASEYTSSRGGGSGNAMSIVNNWLKGNNVGGSRSLVNGYKTDSRMNSLEFLENLIQASGYMKKK